jgi:glycosyltransferase involved in cell wall biosynthesis
MRIIHVGFGDVRLPPPMGGGADLYIVKLALHQAKAGHEVVVLDRKHLRHDPEEVAMEGVRLVRLRAPRFKLEVHPAWRSLGVAMEEVSLVLNQASFALSARKWIKRACGASIVNVHSSVIAAVLSFGDIGGARLVYTSHTPRRLMSRKGVVVIASHILEKWVVKNVVKVIALSAAVKDKLLTDTQIGEQSVEVVPVGIECDQYATGNHRIARNKTGPKMILFLGRVRPEKGVHLLLQAANLMVRARGPSGVNFIIAGPFGDFHSSRMASDYLSQLRSTIEQFSLQGVVKITGRLSAAQALEVLSQCDVFVLPSLTEAMPTSVLEAMCHGKPVVASRVGGIPEQVEDGRSGFLVEPGDARQLSERINFLLENPEVAEAMGSHGRRLARLRFSWDVIVEKILDVYSSVIS